MSARGRLTAVAGVCYGAPTLRGSGDLTFGPRALTEARVHTPRKSRRGGRAIVTALLLVLAVTAGCGPVGYMKQVHQRATEAVEEARRAGAEAAAPYEYTSAVAYLAKAREEGAEAQYGNAIELGRRAEELALQARAIARRQDKARAAPAARPGTEETAPPARETAP